MSDSDERGPAQGWTRRKISAILAGAGLATVMGPETSAKKKKSKKKKKKPQPGPTPTTTTTVAPGCVPVCTNRECGDNGCGGICGKCGALEYCNEGICREVTDYELVAQWGEFGSANGQFQTPQGITVDRNDLVYVADSGLNRIQKFSNNGQYIGQWGEFGHGPNQVWYPTGISDSTGGNIYVTDRGNNRVHMYNNSGGRLLSWGSQGTVDGKFDSPLGIAVSPVDSTVYVIEENSKRVQRFSNDQHLATYHLEPDGLFGTWSIAIGPNGDVYIGDNYGSRIFRLDARGQIGLVIGENGPGEGQFSAPQGIAIDKGGNLFVADISYSRIQVLDRDGNFIMSWKTPKDHTGDNSYPNGIALDSDGNVFLTLGTRDGQILKYKPTGEDVSVGRQGKRRAAHKPRRRKR